MDYPRPHLKRSRWISLDGEWEFGAGPGPRFDRRIRVPFAPQSDLSGLRLSDPGDVVWYRRTFDAPSVPRLLLHFGAVDYRATIFVNGLEVASHEGGYTPFSIDVSHVAGRDGNELVVRAEDPLADRTIPRGKQHWSTRPEGIFYTPTTGIWQSVWLEPLPRQAIESLRVIPDLDSGSVGVAVAARGEADVTVTFAGRVVGRRHGSGVIALEEVHAWSPEAPHLYRLHVDLDGADAVDSHFGLRKVEARDAMFWLNGEPYVQRLVLDQGYFPGGLMTATSGAVFKRDIELARSMGFNGARKHQKVEDPRYLDWADRLGFIVWDEMPSLRAPSIEGERRFAAEWDAVVRRDRDHPCVIVWAPVNESDGMQANPVPFLERIYRLTKELDPSRPVVSNDGWEHATSDLCTLHDYEAPDVLKARYRSLDAALDPAARAQPAYLPGFAYRGEPIVVSEVGGVALAGDVGWGYSEARDSETLLRMYRDTIEALMAPGPVVGFCYTQLYDIEQERNGLCTFDRKAKVDPPSVAAITRTAKRW